MPDEVKLPGQRSREATALIRRYHRVQNDLEKIQAVEMLNQVYPSIRFKHTSEGLVVYHLEGRPATLPLGVSHGASVIIVVDTQGRGRITKHRARPSGDEVPARDMLFELTGAQAPGTKTRWARIEEDWI